MIEYLISTFEHWKIYLEGLKFVDHWQSVVQLFLIILIIFTLYTCRGIFF